MSFPAYRQFDHFIDYTYFNDIDQVSPIFHSFALNMVRFDLHLNYYEELAEYILKFCRTQGSTARHYHQEKSLRSYWTMQDKTAIFLLFNQKEGKI